MLLRRFQFLNYFPIAAIQGQGSAKHIIHIWLLTGIIGWSCERSQTLGNEGKYRDQKDLLTRLLLVASGEGISVSEFVSGFESTTTTVGFSCRLHEELAPFGRESTYDDLQNKVPYLKAVLKETYTLGSPYMERVATKADIIPLHQPIQLANGQVSYSIWGDADAFCPERWLEPLPPQEKLHSGWGKCSRLVIMSSFMNSFIFEDPNATMRLEISLSLQAWVHHGPDDCDRNELPIILVPTEN
ncbi:hypothetical protein ARMGADRAFT_1018980 [Armillaria gallica]|uniref:Cytochrome P450 n=1 Tax=Armillaria gallica TaxID=47427 RepID=A0A2H3D3G8_ARMGA|nr:hypothetical protein ARMGADRAFT_1018980 [Armillaria gallica]